MLFNRPKRTVDKCKEPDKDKKIKLWEIKIVDKIE